MYRSAPINFARFVHFIKIRWGIMAIVGLFCALAYWSVYTATISSAVLGQKKT